jgi:alpha-glucosidase
MTDDAWWRNAVVYQIYPRSFADSDGDGVGDLRGIIDHLDHLAGDDPDALGVDAIWLSPFYPSPQADFGYDISDHCEVDPVYGTLADFDELLEAAHRRGIRVLVDLVMNHTSIEHPWFADARSARDAPLRDFYIWADPAADGGPPNNWLSAFAASGPAWTLDDKTGQYYLHSFTPEQPDLNWRSPAVRDAMRAVWRFWLDRGVDGFRVDVAHRLVKDAALRDNPPELAAERRFVAHPRLRQHNLDQPGVHEVLQDLRRVLDSYGQRTALGEVPIDDDVRLATYFGRDGMQTAFHVGIWDLPWRGGAWRERVDGLAAVLAPDALPTYAMATHDIPRAVTRLGSEARARVAAMMLLTLRGMPCVYYGEEIGMADVMPPPHRVLDVDGRDGTRVPMRWDAGSRGFSTGTAWLPAGPDQPGVDVASQRGDDGSMLGLYRRLLGCRRGSAALRRGTYRSLNTPDEVFAYCRGDGPGGLVVALNFTSDPVAVALPGVPPTARVAVATDPGMEGALVATGALRLGPDEGVVLTTDAAEDL